MSGDLYPPINRSSMENTRPEHQQAHVTNPSIVLRLAALGIRLPLVPTPIANFAVARRTGQLLFLSGQGPLNDSGDLHRGKVGHDVSVQDAYQHARLTGLNLLAVAQQALGSLDRVVVVVKLLGMVNATADFEDHPKVINGCSDLLVQVFGEEIGRGASSSVGMHSLSGNQTVEIEAIFEIAP